MDKNDIDFFINLLKDTQYRTEHTINQMKENGTGEQDIYHPTELSNYDNHPADLASDLFQVEFNNNLKVHQESILTQIRDALLKIDNVTYGKCELCHKDIDIERLKILPYAKLCIECENNKEVKFNTIRTRRPVEEEIFRAPLGRKHLNERDDDEYEGLDYLNDLEKYGSSDTPQDMGGYHDYKEFYTNKIDNQGIVESVENISNSDYKKQLP